MLKNRNIRLLLAVLGVLILGYVLWNVRTIIYYFFSAAVLAFIARPLMKLLGKIKIGNWMLPTWLKSTITLVVFIGILIGFFRLIIPTLINQAHIISQIDTSVIASKLEPYFQSMLGWLDKVNIDMNQVQTTLQDEIAQLVPVNEIGTYVTGIIGGLSSGVIALFSILFIAFFLIKDGSIVDSVIDSLTPPKFTEKIQVIVTETKDLLTRYFVGVVIQLSIVMLVITIGLTILGIKNALLIGVLAGVFNIIPYVGPIIGGILGLSLAATSQLQLNPATDITPFLLTAIIPFAVAQALDNFVLQPLIFSKSVKAHPLEIFIVILAAGSLAGITGMILAVPAYSFLRIVAKEFFAGYKVVQGLTKDL